MDSSLLTWILVIMFLCWAHRSLIGHQDSLSAFWISMKTMRKIMMMTNILTLSSSMALSLQIYITAAMFVSLVQIRPVIFVTVRSIWTCWKVKQVASRCAQVYWRVLELQFWNNRIKVFAAIYESQRILLICGILGVFNMRPPLREDRGWKNTLYPKEGNAWRQAQVQTTWLSPRNKHVQRMSERRTPSRIHHGESHLLSRTGNLLQTHIIVPGNELSSQNWSRHILTSRLTQLRPPRPLSRWLINSLKKRCR